MQTKSDLSLHWMATKTEDNRHLIKELLAPSVSFRCNSAHCFGELFKKSELAFVDMITSKNVTKIVVLRISGSLLSSILTLIISIF